MTEEQLRALLRLKRYELPPPDYFDGLLRDVHRRQRAELLQRPLWKIAFERMQTFFGEHSMSPASYAGAMATLLIFGVGVIGLWSEGTQPGHAGASLAVVPTNAPTQKAPVLQLETRAPKGSLVAGWEQPRPAKSSRPEVRHPRYVIDARPVSYEPTFSF